MSLRLVLRHTGARADNRLTSVLAADCLDGNELHVENSRLHFSTVVGCSPFKSVLTKK